MGGLGTGQNFEFFVLSWNASMASGPVLYQSGLRETARQTWSPAPRGSVDGLAMEDVGGFEPGGQLRRRQLC
ncbi:MAG TPA: hypothetical protein VN829_15380 [Dongiaceae bacterium]|nr:hypothetical protein [Dongiaceae bacterium]